jgi:uncharacterized protein YlxP (DUF503 family)
MIVGAAVVELHVHGSQSLKQKRGVVRSIVKRLRNRFNLSVAEVGGQDTWQRAVLGISVTGADATTVRRVLERAEGFIEQLHLAEVCGFDVQIVDLPYAEAPLDEGDLDLPWGRESEDPERGDE